MKHILRNILIAAALVGLCSSVFAQAPTTPYAVGLRIYNWTRGSRTIQTYVYYPATGTAGGSIVTNAPVANGVFPICEVTHGSGGSPSAMLALIRPLAEAGFIVPAPVFTNRSVSETYSGDLSKDVSQILTNTIALKGAGTPFTGKINTTMIGVSGYSMGGMTTNGLFTAWPDSRIKAAMAMACVRMGAPSSLVKAKILFIHGDQDATCPYSSARQSYNELPAPKAFLTYLGGTHSSYWSSSIWRNTTVDWMRWSLYNDTAARNRLASGAASSQTRWEIVDGSTTIQAENGVAAGGVTFESNNAGFNGTGFANFPTSGGTLAFNNVNGNGGGTKSLAIRYANGGTTTRTGTITVNGVASSISFSPTGSWTTWATHTVTISLANSTTNWIRLASTGQDLGNVDQITVP